MGLLAYCSVLWITSFSTKSPGRRKGKGEPKKTSSWPRLLSAVQCSVPLIISTQVSIAPAFSFHNCYTQMLPQAFLGPCQNYYNCCYWNYWILDIQLPLLLPLVHCTSTTTTHTFKNFFLWPEMPKCSQNLCNSLVGLLLQQRRNMSNSLRCQLYYGIQMSIFIANKKL